MNKSGPYQPMRVWPDFPASPNIFSHFAQTSFKVQQDKKRQYIQRLKSIKRQTEVAKKKYSKEIIN